MEDKVFDVDYSKLNFRIGIDVCENGSLLYIFDVSKDYKVTYHTLIGVIETLKMNFVQQQKVKNIQSETLTPDLKIAQTAFGDALRNLKYPNDISVKNSELKTRVKNAIRYVVEENNHNEGNIFPHKSYDDIMLSDITKLTSRQWLRFRNMGRKSVDEINEYLKSLGF